MRTRAGYVAAGIVRVGPIAPTGDEREQRVSLTLEAADMGYVVIDVGFVVGDNALDQHTYREIGQLARRFDVEAIIVRGDVDVDWLDPLAKQIRASIVKL